MGLECIWYPKMHQKLNRVASLNGGSHKIAAMPTPLFGSSMAWAFNGAQPVADYVDTRRGSYGFRVFLVKDK